MNTEERYFSYYLDELQKAGFIEAFAFESVSFELTPKVSFNYIKETQLKTKVKVETKENTLLQSMSYTPDFVINFEHKASIIAGMPCELKTFITSKNTMTCYIDVKGEFARSTNSTKWTFPIKQKMMYHLKDIYVQKIVPFVLFEKTFTPRKVVEEEIYSRDYKKKGKLLGKKGDSKLKYKPSTLEEWLKTL